MTRSFVLLIGVFLLSVNLCIAQQPTATLKGTILQADGQAVPFASVGIKNAKIGTNSTENGVFELIVPAGQSLVLLISRVGFKPYSQKVFLKNGEVKELKISLKDSGLMATVDVQTKHYTEKREQVSLITLDPRHSKVLPSPFGEFNRLLATLPGVVSNNELSSQYSVRGGNFDENLVYVNDIEIYRPFLVRSGQQEGLSFVNPDLVKNVEFSSGGWQPRFGDKLSSVLNIEYKEPMRTSGSATLGVLAQAAHAETSLAGGRVSVVAGIRRKTAQYLFSKTEVSKGLQTKGQYFPKFMDFQAYVNTDLRNRNRENRRLDSLAGRKTTLGVLMSYAHNRYLVRPESRETTFGSLQTGVMRLFVAFEGQEILEYGTFQSGLKLSHRQNRKSQMDFILSGVWTRERERFDVEGGYNICDVETDPSKSNFNECVFERGVGTYYNYGRNDLDATIYNFLNRNYYDPDSVNHFEYGVGASLESIKDKLYEYNFIDSADYVDITEFLKTKNNLNTYRLSAYAQHTIRGERSTFTYGVRANYWSYNKQWLISPRLQYAYRPRWPKRDAILKAAAGVYQQAPFYREMRDQNGVLNPNIKAQTSYHVIAGLDFKFMMWEREFKFTSEAYFKYITNLIPYDVDNVRLRYYARNMGVAYATGVDFRVGGEFVKGAESWFSLGIMSTRENIDGDSTHGYDADGNVIKTGERGFIRRPTDQRLTLGAFFQDHLPNNPSSKVYLNLIVGTGLPFGVPNSIDYRSVFSAPPYRRVDIGFSKVIAVRDKSAKMGRYFDTVSLGLEILNLLGAQNTISYLWIKDYYNTQYAIPNTLSARFLNVRALVRL